MSVGPAADKKNTNCQYDGTLGNDTGIPCNCGFISQHDLLYLSKVTVSLIIPRVCEALITALDACLKVCILD